jgi:cytochrome c biogenesis protein CcdA
MEDLKNSGVDIQYEEYSFRSKEGMSYLERFGLDSVPAVIINDHAIRFEDLTGNNVDVKSLLKLGVGDALQDKMLVRLERKISKDPEKDFVNVTTCVSNIGQEPVNVTVEGGLCKGVNVVSGNAIWHGKVMPGEKKYLNYGVELDGDVKALPPQSLVYIDSLGVHMILGQETPVHIMKKLSLAAVFLGGLVAGINPCLLAVLAFISAMALSMKGRRIYILFNLLAFCIGLLTIYLLVGIGFLGLVQYMPSISIIMKAGIVILVLSMAVFAFYEAYQVKKNANRPSLFKSFLERYKPLYKKYSLTANFGLGGAFGLIKMPCVGGIYIAILGTIIESGDSRGGLFYLAAYNLGVVLPVLALGALLVLGLSPAIIDAFRKRHRFNLKLATGAILAAMAAGFVLNFL